MHFTHFFLNIETHNLHSKNRFSSSQTQKWIRASPLAYLNVISLISCLIRKSTTLFCSERACISRVVLANHPAIESQENERGMMSLVVKNTI